MPKSSLVGVGVDVKCEVLLLELVVSELTVRYLILKDCVDVKVVG